MCRQYHRQKRSKSDQLLPLERVYLYLQICRIFWQICRLLSEADLANHHLQKGYISETEVVILAASIDPRFTWLDFKLAVYP